MTFIDIILLATPAFLANAAPVFAEWFRLLPSLARPIDGGHTWRGARILGDHKTWRGFIVGMCAGAAMGVTLSFLGFSYLSDFFYGLLFGAYVGFLALLGDAIKSFLKRRWRVPSGHPSLPWDQIDYIVVFLIGTFPIFQWRVDHMLFLLFVAFFGNLITNYVAFKLGIKSTPW